jgi:hypothetical protein
MSLNDEVIGNIRKTTSHKNVKLTDSGNKAIYAAFYYLRETGYKQIIIPDQGGWITYKQYPKKLKLDIIELKTDNGLVIMKELESVCKTAQKLSEDGKGKTAFIVTSLAGYFADQDLKMISEVCKKYGVLLIEDTNAYGYDFDDNKLCNGKLADIIVGSFGKWKVVNNKHGGFISAKNKEVMDVLEKSERVKEKIKPKELDELKLLQNLELAHERLLFLIETCEQLKKELLGMDLNVLHKDKKGVVVVVSFKDDKSKDKIIDYCKRNELEYEECPRYIRVNEKAISIEVKRLEHIGNNDL